MRDVEYLKAQATGRWQEILLTEAPHLTDIICRGRRHGPCQMCGGKDRARCHNDFEETGGVFCNQCGGGADGLAVLMWANGWTFPQVIDAVAGYLGLSDTHIQITHPLIASHKKPEKDWEAEHSKLKHIWDKAQQGTSRLRQYFEYRGLSCIPPDTLRLHPSLEYWHGGRSYGKLSCMVTKIIRYGEQVGINRTFLDSNGPSKAPVPEAKLSKKCADTMTGAAIQLFDPQQNKPLALTEGIETALAVYQHSGWPVWSCVNRILLEKVELPECVKSVVICGDKDKSGDGQRSAEKLARRLVDEGREVKIALPPIEIPEGDKSVDWLNFLTQEVDHVR